MPATTYLIEQLENHIFTDPAYVPPTDLYIGLSTTEPTVNGGNITEPVGNGYSRLLVNAGLMGGVVGGVKGNSAILVFDEPTGPWGLLTHFILFDAITGGNALCYDALLAPVDIVDTDGPQFGSGAFEITIT